MSQKPAPLRVTAHQCIIPRRDFVRGALAGSLASILSAAGDSFALDATNPHGGAMLPDGLGQDCTVVFRVPDKGRFVHDPGLILLPSGRLLATIPCWQRGAQNPLTNAADTFLRLKIMSSGDHGATWQLACELPYSDAVPFLCEGRLYMFIQHEQHAGVWFVTSEDEGRSWTPPVEVLHGRYWNCQTAMVIKDRRLYWAMSQEFEKMGAISCDLSKGLLNPESWRASPMVEMPIPKEVVAGTFVKGGGSLRCLEGNVVDVHGRLRVLARANINHYGTANMAAVFDLNDSGDGLALSFSQLSSLPGGQCKFHILFDEPSQLFWMASNLPPNSQDLIHADPKLDALYAAKDFGTPREDRRFLVLSYSLDALNWFPAGWIAAAEKITQSFMYPSMVVDGDDLVLLSRTARDSGHYHDADLATFHRIRNFRSRAIDIRPRA